MREATGDLVALYRKVVICAVSQDLQHASVEFFEHFDPLFTVVDGSDSSLIELLLDRGLILKSSDVWQLDGVEVVVRDGDSVPDKREAVLAQSLDLLNHTI